jgi:UrcA family protein
MTTFKTIAAALAATIAIAVPTIGAQAAKQSSVLVVYDDLNLASAKGRAVLDQRIERAAVKICGRADGRSAMDRAIAACQRETLAAAKTSRDLAIANYASERLARAKGKVIRLVAQ